MTPELILFPESVFAGLIFGALGLTAVGALSLLFLLLRDSRRKSIW
jgi:hypothetical protein